MVTLNGGPSYGQTNVAGEMFVEKLEEHQGAPAGICRLAS